MSNPPDPLSTSRPPTTGAGYAADWALFVDWCAVTGRHPLPATPETLLEFLADCPAAAATQARRVTAIDHHHRHAGINPPQRTPEIREVLRGRPARPVREEFTAAQVDAALRRLPSHGWTNGLFGRRDRALLVLAHRAGLPYRRIAALTAGDIHLVDGAATIAASTGSVTLQPAEDPVLCGPCALARWLRVLHLAITTLATRTLAGVIDRTPALDAASPHLCRSRRPLTHGIKDVPLLPPINPRGHLAMTPAALTAHSLSHLTRSNGSGRGVLHLIDPQTAPEEATTMAPVPAAPVAAPYSRTDFEQAVARRRHDRNQLRALDDTLADLDRRAAELHRRSTALLADR